MAQQQSFTRRTITDLDSVSTAVNDIYDKLAVALRLTNDIASTPAPVFPSPVPVAQTVISVGGASGQSANPQYAFVPALPTLPSVNPSGGAPYAQDGLLIELVSNPSLAGTLFRYTLPGLAWAGPMIGAYVSDTRANKTNYAAATYRNTIYLESDKLVFYYSNGTAWLVLLSLARGSYEDRLVNFASADLGANDAGLLYVETSRSTIASSDPLPTYRWSGTAWVYTGGVYTRTQGQLATLAATLTANDAGLLVCVSSPYYHELQWSGTAWQWGPGDALDAGMTAVFEVDPVQGWHLYDGSTVTYLKPDGTTGSKTLPDLVTLTTNAAYLKAGSPNTGVNVAVAPNFNGTATDTNNDTDAGVLIATAGATAVALKPHVHSHLPIGLNDTAGEPQNLVRRPFFRV